MKIKLKDFLFFLGYTLIIFSDMFSAVNKISDIVNYIDYIGLAILLFLIILKTKDEKYAIKKIIAILFITAILLLVKFFSTDNLLLKLFIITLAFKNMDISKYIKYDLIIRTIFVCTVVILFKYGMTTTYIMYRENNSIRSSMGFSHPNNFGQYILIICSDYIFLKLDKLKLYHLILPIISIVLINYFSNSRTSIICIVFLIILALIKKFNVSLFDKKIVKNILLNTFLLFSILSILLVYCYNQKYDFALKLDEKLSNRIYYASNFLNEYDINLFGNEITMLYTQEARLTGQQPWVLDNSYFVCILRYGLIAYFVVFLLIKTSLKYFYNEKNYNVIIMWTIFSLNGMLENYLLKIHFNPYLVILSYCNMKNKLNNNEILLKKGDIDYEKTNIS